MYKEIISDDCNHWEDGVMNLQRETKDINKLIGN
jgi:hypothetical protein